MFMGFPIQWDLRHGVLKRCLGSKDCGGVARGISFRATSTRPCQHFIYN